MAQIETLTLRKAMGCFATGVAIVTTRRSEQHLGVTVNSFSSVSLEPPLILFSLVRSANIFETFHQATNFAVNILSQGQQRLSNMFARPSTADWNEVTFREGRNGCALLSDCLVQLECSKVSELDGGDHVIFLAEVSQVHLHGSGDPLLFYRGAYGTYARDYWSKVPPPDTSLTDLTVTSWG